MAFRLDLPDQAAVEGLRCVRVWIPDSDGYESALHSLLTYANRWFAWQRDDAHNGTVAAALWRAAYQQTIEDYFAGLSCDCDTDNGSGNGTPEPCPVCGGGIVIEESDDMGQVVTDVEFDANTGVLRVYFGKCCYTDLDLSGLSTNTGPNPVTWPDPEQVASTCGKAAELIDCAERMIDAGWDNMTDYFGFEPAVRAAAGDNITLSRSGIYILRNALIALSATGSKSETLDTDMVAKAKCLAEVGMEDSLTGTVDEVNYILSSVKSAINEYVPSPNDALVWAVWDQAFETIGYNDRLFLLALGAGNDAADCACPDYDPSALWGSTDDWVYEVYFENFAAPPHWVLLDSNGITIVTQSQMELESNTVGTDSVGADMNPNVTTDCFVTKVLAEGNYPAGFGTLNGLTLEPAGTLLHDDPEFVQTGSTWRYVKTGLNWQMTQLRIELGADPNGTTDPLMPTFTRFKIAGTGPHPFSA